MRLTRRQLRKMILEAFEITGDQVDQRLGLRFPPDTSGINYTALVLDDSSHQLLASYAPPGWKVFAHHMTLIAPTMQSGRRVESYIGMPATIVIDRIAMDDRVIAGIVNEQLSDPLPLLGPTFPHVTIATNPVVKGKPFHSNQLDISQARPIQQINLTGNIQEL